MLSNSSSNKKIQYFSAVRLMPIVVILSLLLMVQIVAGVTPPIISTNTGLALIDGNAITITSAMLTATDTEQTFGVSAINYPTIAIGGSINYEYITNITFAGIDKSSTFNFATGDSSYCDFTEDTAFVLQGETLSLSVNMDGVLYESDRFYAYAYIDWNSDKDWDDANEEIIIASNVLASSFPQTVDVTVPVDALIGPTRMRVLIRYNKVPNKSGNPAYLSGEAEDYIVNIGAEDIAAPTIVKNSELALDEGATALITTDHLVATDDIVEDSKLTFTIQTVPTNGELRRGENVLAVNSTFTQADITNNLIDYVHDHSNTTTDSFTFKVTEGKNELIGQVFAIAVTNIDDTPIVTTNTGLTLVGGNAITITSAMLTTADMEVGSESLDYSITKATVNGAIEYSDAPGTSISIFTQKDIDDGKVNYVHNGGYTFSDSLTFSVTDGTNELTDQKFTVSVTNYPTIAIGGTVNYEYITNVSFAGIDKNSTFNSTSVDSSYNDFSADTASVYPEETHSLSISMTGEIANYDKFYAYAYIDWNQDKDWNDANEEIVIASNIAASSFPQNVNVAVPVNALIGPTRMRVLIRYENVPNKSGHPAFTYGEAEDYIVKVIPVNTNPPTLGKNKTLSLDEGSTTIVTASDLEATDDVIENTALTFTIQTTPVNGELQLNGNALEQNSSFTQDDIDNDRIGYVHNGSNTVTDSCSFTLSDGDFHVVDQKFYISVTPVDDDTPTIFTNKGLTISEGATKSIPLDLLESDDTDTDNLTLIYTVTGSLLNGQLENTDSPENAILSFTQQNLSDGKIEYVHNGSNTTSDSFKFVVADGASNELIVQTFSITITLVNETPTVTSIATTTATEDLLFSYEAAATDPDETTPTISFSHLPNWLFDNGSTVTGTPLDGDGDTSFMVHATDGAMSDSMIVTVTVIDVPDTTEMVASTHSISKDITNTVDSVYSTKSDTIVTTINRENWIDTLFIRTDSLSDDVSYWFDTDTSVSNGSTGIDTTVTTRDYIPTIKETIVSTHTIVKDTTTAIDSVESGLDTIVTSINSENWIDTLFVRTDSLSDGVSYWFDIDTSVTLTSSVIDTVTVTLEGAVVAIDVIQRRTVTEMFLAYPNPVNHSDGEIFFTLPENLSGTGTVTIFDALGTKLDEQRVSIRKGSNLRWDLTNRGGQLVGSGTYVAILKVESNGSVKMFRTMIGVRQ
jgi:hypothetical protein